MPLTPKFCAACGHTIEVKTVADRDRHVCSSCGQIFYQNPLPVAAALVLNERREVLLVRRARPPHEGAWCLPMGFAETGETIADAARRELKEETGVDARVLRLLDADSFGSDHYGDLLIVTFELIKTGGVEQAGDDAAEARYFPISNHPPLAFSSNEKALRACTNAHLEAWEIQDSFVALQREEDRAMLADELIDEIELQAEDIARRWLADVAENPTTPTYQRVDKENLIARAALAISQFGRWFKGDEAADEVKTFYRAIGRQRHEQGFPAHEVLSALMLLKKHLWLFARERGQWERPIDFYRALELSRLIAEFFDKAIFHAVRAYEQEGAHKTQR